MHLTSNGHIKRFSLLRTICNICESKRSSLMQNVSIVGTLQAATSEYKRGGSVELEIEAALGVAASSDEVKTVREVCEWLTSVAKDQDTVGLSAKQVLSLLSGVKVFSDDPDDPDDPNDPNDPNSLVDDDESDRLPTNGNARSTPRKIMDKVDQLITHALNVALRHNREAVSKYLATSMKDHICVDQMEQHIRGKARSLLKDHGVVFSSTGPRKKRKKRNLPAAHEDAHE